MTMTCRIDSEGRIVLDPSDGQRQATMIEEDDQKVLLVPEGAPEMSPELVKGILSEA